MNTERFHAIVTFLCPFTGNRTTNKVWFCSAACRARLTARVERLNEMKLGSLVEGFCSTHLNSNNQCGECDNEVGNRQSQAKSMPGA